MEASRTLLMTSKLQSSSLFPTPLGAWAASVSHSLPYPIRLLLWVGCILSNGALLCALRTKHTPGWPRLRVALPLVLLNMALPLLFDRASDSGWEQASLVAAFSMTTLLSNMKLLGWSLDRGPLVRPLIPPQFLAAYVFAITPREGEGGKEQPKGKRTDGTCPRDYFLYFLLKAAVGAVVGFLLLNWQSSFPRLAVSFLISLSAYCSLGPMMDGSAAVAGWLAGLPVAPHFDKPYLCTTIGEFWSRRWNQSVGRALKFLFFDPMLEGRAVRGPHSSSAHAPWRRMAALLGTFLASGLLHEAMLWYLSGRVFGHHMVFFTLMGPVVVLEATWRHWLHRCRIRVPTWLAWIAVTIIMQVSGDRLFWEPIYRSGTPQRGLAAMQRAFPWMKLKH